MQLSVEQAIERFDEVNAKKIARIRLSPPGTAKKLQNEVNK